MAVSC